MSAQKSRQIVIINHVPGEECRIAIFENGVLEEFYTERMAENLHVGNIYLGVVVNVEPSIQAAFVDFGIGRNGFLHISDVHPMYFPKGMREGTEAVGRKTPHRDRPPIQECLKKGQRLIVQVIKEGIGTKGPTLTSYPSIPGRYLVMMPYMEHHGVSRKLEDIDERREAKKVLDSIDFPRDFGFILRTAGLSRTKTDLRRDLQFLTRLWKEIEKKKKDAKGPTELYAESDLLLRTVRDVISPDVERIWVDNADAQRRIDEYLRIVAPRRRTTRLMLHHRPIPIFHDFGVEQQLESMYRREVPLNSGGSIIIDQTEAMVAIDVNSGKSRKFKDAETTAYQVNIEAVEEIARQLRLRDLGGLILIDFIDMRERKHQRSIENRIKELLKRDRAKTEVQRISKFGILEMTRQRMRPTIRRTHFVECPHCGGSGNVKSGDSVVTDGLRHLAYLLQDPHVHKIELVVSTAVAGILLSRKRKALARIEERIGKQVDIRISKTITTDRIDFYAYDSGGSDIDLSRLKFEIRDPHKAEPDELPEAVDSTAESETDVDREDEETKDSGADDQQPKMEKSRRRRRRSRRSKGAGESADQKTASEKVNERPGETKSDASGAPSDSAPADEKPRRKRRRRGRKKRDESARDDSPRAGEAIAKRNPNDSAVNKESSTDSDRKKRPSQPNSEPSRTSKAATVETTSRKATKGEEQASAAPTGSAESGDHRGDSTVESTGVPAAKKSKKKKRRRKPAKTSESSTELVSEAENAGATKKADHKKTEVSAEDETSTQRTSAVDGIQKKKAGRRRRKTTKKPQLADGGEDAPEKKATSGNGKKTAGGASPSVEAGKPQKPSEDQEEAEVSVNQKKRRRLYGSRRRLRPDEVVKISTKDE